MSVIVGDDPELVARIEHLASHCPHHDIPCQACTDLAVDAVSALADSGWLDQIRRYHHRKETT